MVLMLAEVSRNLLPMERMSAVAAPVSRQMDRMLEEVKSDFAQMGHMWREQAAVLCQTESMLVSNN